MQSAEKNKIIKSNFHYENNSCYNEFTLKIIVLKGDSVRC